MHTKERIIDALSALFAEGKAGTASVSDIAKKAGIAKGGMYYYFRSKEEVLDALVEREYAGIIKDCEEKLAGSKGTACQKFALLLAHYRSAYVDPSLDACLHMPQNAAIHQKSLAQILSSLSLLVANILRQGIAAGDFICDSPQEYAEIILSVFTFLLDPGIFPWTKEQYAARLTALAHLLERGLAAQEGSFSFLYTVC